MRVERPPLVFGLASLVAHVPLFWVLVRQGAPPWSLAAVGGLLLVMLGHLGRRLHSDVHRPRWSRLVDEALFVYWALGIIAIPWLALFSVLAGLGDALVGAGEPVASGMPMLAAYVLALAMAIWGVAVDRRWVRVTRQVVELENLPVALERFTIAHLSDLHVGSTDPKTVALRWVQLCNRSRPDVVFVTGDLVTNGTSFYADACDVLGALLAPHGVFLVLGNHDQARPEQLRSGLEQKGVQVLDNGWQTIGTGHAALCVAGLDAAKASGSGLCQALASRPHGIVTVLLSHYPDVFEEAATRYGVELVLSGHTHGGQVGLPWLGDRVNLATLLGKPCRGLYERGTAKLFVTAGLGTTNVPFRLGVRPEIALLELRRTQAGAELSDRHAG